MAAEALRRCVFQVCASDPSCFNHEFESYVKIVAEPNCKLSVRFFRADTDVELKVSSCDAAKQHIQEFSQVSGWLVNHTLLRVFRLTAASQLIRMKEDMDLDGEDIEPDEEDFEPDEEKTWILTQVEVVVDDLCDKELGVIPRGTIIPDLHLDRFYIKAKFVTHGVYQFPQPRDNKLCRNTHKEVSMRRYRPQMGLFFLLNFEISRKSILGSPKALQALLR